MNSSSSTPTWLEIDLEAVRSNSARVIEDTGTNLMAIVKGDAYGHGAVEVSRAALAGGASWLGVARFGEARLLRQSGIQAPILVLGMLTQDEVDEAIPAQVTLTLHSQETLLLFSARARAAGRTLRTHLKLDTGMGRLGIFAGETLAFARQAQAAGGLELDGVFSHLAAAETPEQPLNALQAQRFQTALNALKAAGLCPKWIHLANSAAAFYLPETRHNLVRVGNVVLGLRIRIDQPLPAHYRPALSWKARLAACRLLPADWGVGYGPAYTTRAQELIGVVPAGYGDGLRRTPGNQVLIGGEKLPVVGGLCLDQLMVRLPRAYAPGEEVVLIGEQGSQSIRVHDLAALYGTSQVDITTHLHQRLPRIYSAD